MSDVKETRWQAVLATIVLDRDKLKNEKFPRWFSQALAERIIRAHDEEGVCTWSKCRSRINAQPPSPNGICELMDSWVVDVFVEVYLLASQGTLTEISSGLQ